MRNYKVTLYSMLFLMLFSVGVFAQEEYFTESVEATVSSVNAKNRTVTINGKSYQYDIDASKSEYSEEETKDALVPLRDIKSGEKYYFTLYYYGRENENVKIVFVSTRLPLS
ncbi:hypothetical protein [Marinicella sp. W31]|uniref:hypothetical protein n=1 Tax=Marinicella sp. W31 TaxID=3023713 RepID=UPI00375769AC